MRCVARSHRTVITTAARNYQHDGAGHLHRPGPGESPNWARPNALECPDSAGLLGNGPDDRTPARPDPTTVDMLPWVLGDVKREYVDIIAGLGGQVITLGRGRGYLNEETLLDLLHRELGAHLIGA